MNIHKLRKKTFNIIKENFDNDSDDNGMLNILNQFELPDDLEYIPTNGDVKAVEDTWGKGKYIHKPLSKDEKEGISTNLKNAKLDLPNDEKELKDIEQTLNKNKGGSVERRMSNLGMSAN